MVKGQSKIIEYVFVIFLSVIVILAISITVYSFYRVSLENSIRSELEQIAIETSQNIMELYESGKKSNAIPQINSSLLLGEVEMSLPSQVSKRNYRIELVTASDLWIYITNLTINQTNVSAITDTSGAKVIVKTTQDPKVEVEESIPNIDAIIEGMSENGNGLLRYYRYNLNGNITDAIILGNNDIFIQVTGE